MDLHVRRMKSRYRLPTSGSAVGSRLDAIATGLLGEVMSVAVEVSGRGSSGVSAGADEEICVRHARVVLRVRASESDADVAAKWGAIAADTIKSAVVEGDPSNVVRYASRAQALADFASAAARGDIERQWAWRQLGLWRAPPSPSVTTARGELLRALDSRPRAIVPTLSALARRGELRPLVTSWSAVEIRRLAETALLAANAPAEIVAAIGRTRGERDTVSSAAPASGSQTPREASSGEEASPEETTEAAGHLAGSSPGAEGPDVSGKAARALAASPIGAFVLGARDLPREALESLVVMAALDTEPATLRAGSHTGERLVRAMLQAAGGGRKGAEAAVAHKSYSITGPDRATGRIATPAADSRSSLRRIGPRLDLSSPRSRETGSSEARGDRPVAAPGDYRPTPDDARASARQSLVAKTAPDRAGSTSGPNAAPGDSRSPNSSAATTAEAADADAAARRAGARGAASPSLTDPLDEGAWDVDRRASGATRAGGLLFLLHIVGELGIADALADDQALGARPMRWALHQLALVLGDIEDRDPAALAFAGLGPDAEPPSIHEEPPTVSEREALSRLVSRVVARLEERLGPAPAPARLAPPSAAREDVRVAAMEAPGAREALLGITRRHAVILADPGWFEVRLSLDEVRTDVRRAGLDLDPDYLPWLGVVVRFTYA